MQDYYNSEEFQATLSRYNQSKHDGVACYMDSDDIINLSNYFLDQGNSQDAFDILDLGLRLHPDNVSIHLSHVAALIFSQNYQEASDELDSIDDYEPSDYLYLRAQLICALEDDVRKADNFFSEWYEIIKKDILDEGKVNFVGYENNPDAMLRNALNLILLSYVDLLPTRNDEFIRKWINRYINDFSPLGRYDEDLTLANVCNTLEYFDLIETVYTMILEENPYITQGFTILGASQQINGKTDKAIESLDFALAINPDDIQANITMAHCLFLKQNYEKALHYFTKFQELSNTTNDSLYIGLCHLYLNNIPEAHRYFNIEYEKLIANPVDNDTISQYINLSDAFFNCSDYIKTEEILNSIKDIAKDNIDYNLLRGYLSIVQDDVENALLFFNNALNMSNDIKEMLIVMSSRLISLNHNEMALYYLSMVVDNIDKEPHKDFYYNAYAFLALAQYNLSLIELALENLKIACEKVPHTVKQIWGNLPDSVNPQDYYDYLSKLIY